MEWRRERGRMWERRANYSLRGEEATGDDSNHATLEVPLQDSIHPANQAGSEDEEWEKVQRV
jgi:hypothetical protein